jgi:hypothetical protein
MEFTVYGHELVSGSDVGMHFSASLQQSEADADEYRNALRLIDPTGEPLGTLGIYEITLRMPDVATFIYVLNSPGSLCKTCVVRRKLVVITVD